MRRFGFWQSPAYAAAGWGCGPHRHAGFETGWEPPGASFFSGPFGEGWQFGVKRPLRFLAYKLGLERDQVTQLARLLDQLKTERAQAAVDERRTLTAFADAMAGESFDQARAEEGATLRRNSSERVRAAVVETLPKIHAILTQEQREQFAYLIRTGALML